MRKIVAMAVICLTAASGLTSAYAAQLADDEAGTTHQTEKRIAQGG
ncbi:outer membrane porin protein [Escherichia coli]|nr:outer membrane porin protein [Escherichia coli]CTX20540.1 outer membrane porin protein [Escherichia coli]VEB56957.1 outer membrane porin protein [Escherichia coli]